MMSLRLLALACAVACSGTPATSPDSNENPATVSIDPTPYAIVTGDTLPLSARIGDSGAGSVTWSVTPSGIVSINASGQVVALAPGVVTLKATAGSSSTTRSLTVFVGQGPRVATMASYDSVIPTFMARYGVPGASVAVMKDGKLVFARGYGWADTAAKVKVDPSNLFRLASVSKPITSAAIMKLVEQGKLSLDDKAFSIVSDLRPPAPYTLDPRYLDITIRHLLTHSGGWDRDASGDPMFMSSAAASALGQPAPATLPTVVRYWMEKPLDFAPGTKYVYSNFGYAILQLVIDRVSGTTYEDYVKTNILGPAGATHMQLGRTQLSTRASGEVQYYDPYKTTSVFPGGGSVYWPDGGFYLEPMAAHGGWLASAPDLLRFSGAVDGLSNRPDVISSSSIAEITTRSTTLWPSGPVWYGFGWMVNTVGNWWHNGSLPGTTTLLVRRPDGVSWVILLNSRTTPTGMTDINAAVDNEMWAAVQRVTVWPTQDLFGRY